MVSTALTESIGWLAAGDFNGDGKADLASVLTSNCSDRSTCLPGNAVIFIGNGDGTFQTPAQYPIGLNSQYVAVGDFNGDGKVDLAVSNTYSSTVSILLNTGTGTFQPHVDYATATDPGPIAIGDFKGNGILDLAIFSPGWHTISVLLGNGDGTFQKQNQVLIPGQDSLSGITTGDFNGDGKLDLAVTDVTANQVMIFLGNGDGTFQSPISSSAANSGYPTVADFNGDGKPDLIIGGEFTSLSVILFGNGDGTFQPPLFAFPGSGPPAVADFNEDGSPDVAGGPGEGSATTFQVIVTLSTAFKALSPSSLNFGSQGVGITSAAQAITLSNPSNVSLNIASIKASANFSQTNSCGATLAPGSNCTITVKFAPTAAEALSGAITITDNTKISPLAIAVTGTGVNGPFLTAEPNQAGFAGQAVGTKSTSKSILLVNTGNAALTISGISLTGTNSSDFSQTNTCGGSLAVGGNCSVNVTFSPTVGGARLADIAIVDNVSGSPQMVALSGVGIAPDFSVQTAPGSATSQTVSQGQNATFNLAITPSGSFSGTVNLSCSVSPTISPAPTCNLSSSSVQLSGTPQPVTVTVQTIAAVNSVTAIRIDFPPRAMPIVWEVILLGLGWLLLRSPRRILRPAALLMLLASIFLVGCGGGGGSPPHYSGNTGGYLHRNDHGDLGQPEPQHDLDCGSF